MRISVTVEVESREALAAILKTGIEHSLYDCQVLTFTQTIGWKPASSGSGPRHWFVMNEETRRWLHSATGQLVRFATCEAAQRRADELNKGAL
jgi:hypothetical protein